MHKACHKSEEKMCMRYGWVQKWKKKWIVCFVWINECSEYIRNVSFLSSLKHCVKLMWFACFCRLNYCWPPWAIFLCTPTTSAYGQQWPISLPFSFSFSFSGSCLSFVFFVIRRQRDVNDLHKIYLGIGQKRAFVCVWTVMLSKWICDGEMRFSHAHNHKRRIGVSESSHNETLLQCRPSKWGLAKCTQNFK